MASYRVSYKSERGRKLVRDKSGKPAEFATLKKAKNFIRNNGHIGGKHSKLYADMKIVTNE